MAWTQQGSIRGPQGEQGPQGPEGPQGAQGPAGADGTGVTILGSYATVGELQTTHPTGSPGDAYLVAGSLYVWDQVGQEWDNVGSIQGPKGDQGDQGPTGPTGAQGSQGEQGPMGATGARGATWYTGTGAPVAQVGEAVGDLYLDVASGTVYKLS